MSRVSEKDLDEFIQLSKKHGIEYKDRDEARTSAQNLISLAEIGLEVAKQERLWKEKLKESPVGFEIEGEGRGCCLCHRHISDKMHYDKWGLKCMDCHEAHKKKIIPGYVFKDSDNEKHFILSRISWKVDLPMQTLRKLVRQGKIKVRDIGHGESIVLRSENPNLRLVIEDELERRR